MRNFAVKFAILSHRFDFEVGIQDYMDLPPEEMLRKYRLALSTEEQGALMFGFSDVALLEILDREFEVEMDRNVLIFRKNYLDAASIRMAGRLDREMAREFNRDELRLIESLTDWLFDVTRSLYRPDIPEDRIEDIRQEYRENIRLYAAKYGMLGEAKLYSLFSSINAMKAFAHAMTVDALMKADAARVVFGESSGYCQAWMRKKIFRHMIAQTVEAYIDSFLQPEAELSANAD